MIQQEILRGLSLSVGNGGMCLKLTPPKAVITKHDGSVFLNGVAIPFVSPNDLPERECSPQEIAKLIIKSTKVWEAKKGDAIWR